MIAIGLLLDPPKLRFENPTNEKKTLKQAWRYFSFVLFIRDRDRIRTYDRLLRRQMLYPAELRDRTKYPLANQELTRVLAERLGFEPRQHFRVDRLAICSITTLAPLLSRN